MKLDVPRLRTPLALSTFFGMTISILVVGPDAVTPRPMTLRSVASPIVLLFVTFELVLLVH